MQTWVSQMRMRELFSRNHSLTNTTILRKDARVGKHLIFIMIQACDEVFFWKSSVFISFFFFFQLGTEGWKENIPYIRVVLRFTPASP